MTLSRAERLRRQQTEDNPLLDNPRRTKPKLVPAPMPAYRDGERVTIAESPRSYRTIVVRRGLHIGTLTRPETIQLLALGVVFVGPVRYSVASNTPENS